MKLYSRIHVFILSISIAVIVSVCAFMLGFHLAQQSPASTPKNEVIHPAPASHEVSETNSESLPVFEANRYTTDEQQNIFVYEKANEAVVNITTETVGVNFFLEPVPLEGGSGSGSIIDARGYVLTNTHVIEEASKIYISLYNGSQFKASVVGIDKENDLAVLKFTPPKDLTLTPIQFGNSARLKVGQKVLAIGNPFGFDRTLTVGIVSALGRPIQNDRGIIIKNMIQTDTAINPGNSGGPLLDTSARMIGINTIIYSTSGSSAGIGFAVPIDTAKRVVADLIKYGKVQRGAIDARLVQLNKTLAQYADLPTEKGLLVSEVEKGSLAERAGLVAGKSPVRYGFGRNSQVIYLGGDIITAIEGQPVANLSDYYAILEDKKPNDTVSVTVLRKNRKHTLSITLSQR